MPKPLTLPRWASDPAAPITEPAEGKKDLGFEVGERPPAQVLNWWFGLVSLWVAWLNDLLGEALTWTAAHTFAGGLAEVPGYPAPVTRRRMLFAMDFQADTSYSPGGANRTATQLDVTAMDTADEAVNNRGIGIGASPSQGGNALFLGGLQLPPGAVVTELYAYLRREGADAVFPITVRVKAVRVYENPVPLSGGFRIFTHSILDTADGGNAFDLVVPPGAAWYGGALPLKAGGQVFVDAAQACAISVEILAGDSTDAVYIHGFAVTYTMQQYDVGQGRDPAAGFPP